MCNNEAFTMKRRSLSIFLTLTLILSIFPNAGLMAASASAAPWKGGGTYYTDIPTDIEIGTYTVRYKVVGGRNHNDVEPTSVTVRIISEDDAGNTPDLTPFPNGGANGSVSSGGGTADDPDASGTADGNEQSGHPNCTLSAVNCTLLIKRDPKGVSFY